MNSKIRYSDEPIGKVEIVPDFLPSPAELAFREEGVKVTLALSKKSVDFFKSEATRHHTQYQRYCDGFIMVELADYGGFSAKVATSKFGQFLRRYDENYANYAINNDFRDNANTLISDFNNAGYAFTLRTSEYGIFNVYQQLVNDEVLYIVTKKQPKITRDFTFDYRLVDNDCMMLKRSDDLTQKILNAYRVGRLRFETPQIKAEFSMILGGLLQQTGIRK